MPRAPVKSKPSRRSSITKAQVEQAILDFEWCFAVVDGAVTGSIIEGMHPNIFERILCFCFLQTALQARDLPESTLSNWAEQDEYVFDEVLTAIKGFVRTHVREDIDQTLIKELQFLENQKTFNLQKVSELERRRLEARAFEVITWVKLVFGRRESIPLYVLELVFLVQYLKVASLCRLVDVRSYVTVRETIPMAINAYDHLIVPK